MNLLLIFLMANISLFILIVLLLVLSTRSREKYLHHKTAEEIQKIKKQII